MRQPKNDKNTLRQAEADFYHARQNLRIAKPALRKCRIESYWWAMQQLIVEQWRHGRSRRRKPF